MIVVGRHLVFGYSDPWGEPSGSSGPVILTVSSIDVVMVLTLIILK